MSLFKILWPAVSGTGQPTRPYRSWSGWGMSTDYSRRKWLTDMSGTPGGDLWDLIDMEGCQGHSPILWDTNTNVQNWGIVCVHLDCTWDWAQQPCSSFHLRSDNHQVLSARRYDSGRATQVFLRVSHADTSRCRCHSVSVTIYPCTSWTVRGAMGKQSSCVKTYLIWGRYQTIPVWVLSLERTGGVSPEGVIWTISSILTLERWPYILMMATF